jgi:hypothetical protein
MYPTKEELKERFAGYSNEKLIGIMHEQEQYTPEALEIARIEIESRNITDADVQTVTTEFRELKIASAINAVTPLTLWWKVFYFFLWFTPVIGFALTANYREDGFLLKIKQSRFFAVTGFCSVIINFSISDWLQLPLLVSWIIALLLFAGAYNADKVIDYRIERE